MYSITFLRVTPRDGYRHGLQERVFTNASTPSIPLDISLSLQRFYIPITRIRLISIQSYEFDVGSGFSLMVDIIAVGEKSIFCIGAQKHLAMTQSDGYDLSDS